LQAVTETLIARVISHKRTRWPVAHQRQVRTAPLFGCSFISLTRCFIAALSLLYHGFLTALGWCIQQRHFFTSLMRSTTQGGVIARAPTGLCPLGFNSTSHLTPLVSPISFGFFNNPRRSSGHNPVGVERLNRSFPRVARGAQPWAMGRNPVGVLKSKTLAPQFRPLNFMGNEQGNALGWLPFVVKALKGRPNRPWLGRPFRAPSSIGLRFPGRCPGLSLAAPLGLVTDLRRSDLKCRWTVSEEKETALVRTGRCLWSNSCGKHSTPTASSG
jgi:hypothetical protein